MDFAPTRTEPLVIYRDVIIPDLEFAVEHLSVGDYNTTTTPTKKAALGFLAKACLQTYEYGSTEFLQKGLDAAKELISDCESGGSRYNAYMYPTFAEVFDEANNWGNKEALWKHRWYAGKDGHGSSNGNYKLNRNDEYFLCNINKFGAREDTQEARLTWEGCISGIFMPTQHLLNLFVQADGTLDPRFHQIFQTEWKANKNYTWDESAAANYGIYQLFEYVDEANADSLVAVMTQDDILEAGTEVISFSNEGGDAELELNQLIAGYDSASEDQILACVANTFIENLGLDKLTITVDGETYGPLTFNDDYATVK